MHKFLMWTFLVLALTITICSYFILKDFYSEGGKLTLSFGETRTVSAQTVFIGGILMFIWGKYFLK
jgi:hypothetical protein